MQAIGNYLIDKRESNIEYGIVILCRDLKSNNKDLSVMLIEDMSFDMDFIIVENEAGIFDNKEEG
jgi:hypothetical protein